MLLHAAEYHEAAEPAYLNAQDLMPGDVRWPYYLGHLYKTIGQTQKSIDAFTREVIAAVQADGTCWLGGPTWHDMAAVRISVSNWATSEEDVRRSAEAMLRSIPA